MTTTGPFIHSGQTSRKIMVMVLVSLAPILLAAVVRYGAGAGVVIACAVAGAWLTELVLDRAQAFDCSALVTGAIFALLLPPTTPWWLALVGGAVAIGIGKHAFGGLGCNLFNPAALSRVLQTGSRMGPAAAGRSGGRRRRVWRLCRSRCGCPARA